MIEESFRKGEREKRMAGRDGYVGKRGRKIEREIQNDKKRRSERGIERKNKEKERRRKERQNERIE